MSPCSNYCYSLLYFSLGWAKFEMSSINTRVARVRPVKQQAASTVRMQTQCSAAHIALYVGPWGILCWARKEGLVLKQASRSSRPGGSSAFADHAAPSVAKEQPCSIHNGAGPKDKILRLPKVYTELPVDELCCRSFAAWFKCDF